MTYFGVTGSDITNVRLEKGNFRREQRKQKYKSEIIKRQFQNGTEKAKYKSEIRKKAISEGNSESKNTKVRL